MKKQGLVQEVILFFALIASAAASLYSMSAGTPAAFWPANGFFVALLLLADLRRWVFWTLLTATAHFILAILVGHRSVYLAGVGTGLTVFLGVATSYLCSRLVGPDLDFTQRKVLKPFVFKCALPSAFLGVTIAYLLITLVGPSTQLLWNLPGLFSQEFFGITFITPGVVVATGRFGQHRRQGSRTRAVILMSILIGSEAAIFALHLSPALFLIFPWIVAISLNVGTTGAGLAAVTSSLLAFAFSLRGLNPVALAPTGGAGDAFLIQLFALAADTTALLGAGAIAEQVRLRDAALGAAQTAERATAAKSEFIALISHEIRTPLNGVLGTAQVLARQPLAAEHQSLVATIDQSGRSLMVILNDMLDLSKMQAGKLELERVAFDLRDLTEGVINAFAATAGAKGIEFSSQIGDTALGLWMGDPTRIRQVLSNLISNAIKFTEVGSVRVVATATSGPVLSIAVVDTGPGIAPEVLPRLFEDFAQADASVARRHGGTGLGLAICRRLAGMMGGTLTVESIVGRGSIFTLSAPLERGEAAVEEANFGEDAVFDRPLKILAAEDNLVNQAVLKAMLGDGFIDLTLVGDGVAALEALQNEAFDLVLMDVRMPIMDGLTAVRELRRKEAQGGVRRTPVVALTADAMEHQISEYRAAGMDGMVEKPIDMTKLFAAIEDALRSETEEREDVTRLSA